MLSCQQDAPRASEEQHASQSPMPTKQRFNESPGHIVFQSDRDGDWDIYVLNVEDGELVQLTHNTADDEYPVWSPDGRQIAFKSNRTGNFDIYVMQADGTDQRQVTVHPGNDEDPAWSPDGTMLAFHSDRESTLEIHLIQPDGNGLTPFTKTIGKNGLPAWSPDGSRIAYTGNRYLGWNVYVTTLDRNSDERITDGHGACRPDWSPDGATIAYVSQEDSPKANIWLMKPDGSDRRPLTQDHENYDYYPAWSPDGRYLVYAKSPDKEHGNWELYLVSVDGTTHIRLTNHPARDKFPDWFGGTLSASALARLTIRQEFAYEAEQLSRTIGSVVQDHAASGGKTVLGEPSDGKGFLTYGPYAQYAAGGYTATFRLKIDKTSARKSLGFLDVAADAGQTIIARRELTRKDVSANEQYLEIPFAFSLSSTNTLEFRVFSQAVTAMRVDSIRVEEMSAEK